MARIESRFEDPYGDFDEPDDELLDVGDYDEDDYIDDYFGDYLNDIEQGRWDDDPNPYHGDYSEE